MAEPTWVLGFDGDCLTCRQLAEEVARLANGRLAVRSLREPEVVAWRARALGADAPWAPTLLRVQGARVEAWTGRRLAWHLARLLGPSRALALAERLVALNGASRPATASVTRRGFLGKLGAAALAAVLLASGRLPSSERAMAVDAQTGLRIEPADERTRAALLRQAQQDRRVRLLRNHLQSQGFIPEDAPQAVVAYHEASLVRTVLAEGFRARASGFQATLAFGVEASGDTWAYVLAIDGTRRGAWIVDDQGAVQWVDSTVTPLVNWRCFVCLRLCQIGVCALGCGIACTVVCGGNIVCALVCSGICGDVCSSTGCDICYQPGWDC